MKKKNTGKEYENMLEIVFTKILNQDSVQTVDLQRNVTIQGITTTHEIDILWSFQAHDITYTTVVQAKDEIKPIPKGKIIQFNGVLKDIPGQPKGMFVTKTGYQSGAIEYAKNNGIPLYEFRKLTDKDWEDKIKTIIIRGHFYYPSYNLNSVIFDEDWIREETNKSGVPKGTEINLFYANETNRIYLYDKSNNIVNNIHDLIISLFPNGYNVITDENIIHKFDNETFIDINSQYFDKVKILGINATINVSLHEMKSEIHADELICFILKNVIEGTEVTLDNDLNINK